MLVQRFLAWAIILLQLRQGCCVCYFPGELHGVWETQVTTGRGGRSSRPPTIHYQNITIHSDLIVQWGFCHTRIDNDIILSDRTGSSECFRCVRVDMVSPSLVQVWTTGLETCYTTEDAALRTCPAPADRASRRASQIMLYRIKSSWDEREVEGCPLIGRYTFTYRRGSNGVTAASCDQPTSEFSNCPYGFGFNVIYRDCSFPTPERRGLQCLGSWVGEDQNNYLAVWESSVNDANDNLPRYKCGMFREEAGTGRILLALSEDSTCTNGLSSPADGYETYVMTSVPSPPLPPDVSASTCTFPRTLLGHWHHTFVADNTIIFKDYLHYMTYSASCVRDMDDGERYIVYTRTHCGDWKYNCLWLKRRSANVLEFMLGLYPRETFDLSLCDADKFGDMTSWITQGKSLLEEPTTCPIVGTYAGQLPDASGICAQLYSDCDSPEIMYYTVSACRNASTVYEQREYQCLGQWEEEGRVYALTYRRDIHTYECFVGVIKTDGVVFIKEAGARCSRGVQPVILGMKLHRKASCTPKSTPTRASQSSQRNRTRPPATSPPWLHTTKPWKPITGRPSHRGSGCEGLLVTSNLLLLSTLALNLLT